MFKHRRVGFTLVELLVVIAIIGILIALLLPAVQSARESARRTHCLNNLKQLSLALHHAHQTHNTMPTYWGKFPERGQGAVDAGWFAHILPYLEQNNTYDVIAAGGGINGQTQVVVTPASPDYTPGRWEYPSTGYWETIPGGEDTDDTSSHQGHKYPKNKKNPPKKRWVGDPPVWIPGTGTPPVTTTETKGLDAVAGQNFKTLQCISDPSKVQPNTTIKFRFSQPWSLSNYLANYNAMAAQEVKNKPTRFSQLTDGLSNTLLLAEGMRLCDGTYRFSMWNDYAYQHSHNFGVDWNGKVNTFMFQSVPHHGTCNNWRVQGLHYGNLNVALADGSVRPVLKQITRMEISNPDAPSWGVDPEMGTDGYGVWDRLLLPTDGESLGSF